jgi:hypothetical protein
VVQNLEPAVLDVEGLAAVLGDMQPPSNAIDRAYSYPDQSVLTGPPRRIPTAADP